MSTSIERRLSRMLVTFLGLAALSSGLISFVCAYREAEEFQDDMLRQIAYLVSWSDWRAEGKLPLDEEVPDVLSRFEVLRGPPAHMPDWIPRTLDGGLHTLGRGPERVRVYVRNRANGERILIAQSTRVRDDIAFSSALADAVPVFLMLPLLLLLAIYIVRSELARLRKLAESVDRSSPERLEMLPSADVPAEVGLFVAAINRLITRINRLVEEQRRFVADAAHELRSPLTALALQVQNVDKADSLQAVRERLVPLTRGLQRAQRVAEQLLSLARANTEGERGPVDVSRLTRELIQQYQPLARERGIDLGLDEREHLEVLANADALTLILKNALDNALTYTPPRGEVTVRLFGEAEEAVVEVVDDGPGIASEERDRVFAPFYRSPATPGDGSGLGLAIARDAAARLGGSIRLGDRDAGPGLVFQYRQKRAVSPRERHDAAGNGAQLPSASAHSSATRSR